MRKIFTVAVMILVFVFCHTGTNAQERSTAKIELIKSIHDSYQDAVNNKLEKFNSDIRSATEKFLKRMAGKQRKLMRKPGTDSLLNSAMIGDPVARATSLFSEAGTSVRYNYQPYLDTLAGSLGFLGKLKNASLPQGNPALLKNLELLGNVKAAIGSADKIKALLQEQQNILVKLGDKYKKQVQDYLGAVKKEFYYYNEKVKNYKELLSDPSKIEEKLLSVLRELPAFKSFMKENSMLAGLFPVSQGDQSVAGLQTRDMIQVVLKEKLSSSSVDVKGLMSQQLQIVHAKMDELKQKLSGSANADDLPDFKPKDIKTKTFLQRMELGSNLKFTGKNAMLPASTEVMLSAGYKFSDKASMGIGFMYRLGLGEGFKKIALSNQGIGITSYCRMELKKNFFLSGGWEQNYFNSFGSIRDIGKQHAWKSSALMGIGKKMSFGKSFLGNKWGKSRTRSNTITILYDFLHRQSLPHTEAFKIRFGIAF
jgi:hypothetical protein